MTDKTNEEDGNLISFPSKQDVLDTSSEEFLKRGLEDFHSEIEGATGFLAIIFDADNNPKIIWAGKPDLLQWVGAMEVAKNDFIKTVATVTTQLDD